MKASGSALRISVAAMIVALSVVIAWMPSFPGPLTKFAGFPLLLGGLLVGPRTGFAIGCLTDLIGFMLHPNGPFFPGFTLTQALTATLPAWAVGRRDPLTWGEPGTAHSESRKDLILSYLRLLSVFGVTQGITSVLMVSYFKSRFVTGTPLKFELLNSSIAQAVHVPLYAFVALAILRELARTDLYLRLLKARR